MKKILLIGYAYPPISSPGAVRGTRMLKYLKDYNWDGSVLTVANGYSLRIGGLDDPLENSSDKVFRVGDPIARVNAIGFSQAEDGKKLHLLGKFKALSKTMFKSLLFPDRSILWAFKARTWQPLLNEAFDVVYSTSPTASTHILGYRISRNLNKPWVAEFRDPLSWLDNKNPASSLRRHALKKYEAWVVKNATAIVVISETFKEYFEDLYPKAHIVVIPNGAEFDEAEITKLMKERASRPRDINEPIKLVHTGAFYGGARPPGPVIKACKRAMEKSDLKFEFICAGNDVDLALKAAQDLGCPEIIKDMGVLPHSATIDLLRSADASVSILMDEPLAKISIPSKFLDYLPAGAPVLNLGAKDYVLSRIIEDERAGASFEFDDIEGIADWLIELPNMPLPDTLTLCQNWSSSKMAKKMVELFKTL